MAITSLGYDGTIGEGDVATWSAGLGAPPHRVSGGDATIRTGVVGGIRVPAGVYAGFGVRDVLTGNTDIATTVMAGDGSRWDTVALRRNWATNTTSVVVIQGSAAVAPTVVNSTPGILADQPIFLARMTKGQTDVQQILPWAPWANPPLVWPGVVLPPASAYDDGQILHWAATTDILVRATVSGAPVWRSITDPPWTLLNVKTSGDWTLYTPNPPKVRLRLGKVELEGAVRMGASPGSDYTVLTLPAWAKPSVDRFAGGHHSSSLEGVPYEIVIDSATGKLLITPQWGGQYGISAIAQYSTYPISGTYPL